MLHNLLAVYLGGKTFNDGNKYTWDSVTSIWWYWFLLLNVDFLNSVMDCRFSIVMLVKYVNRYVNVFSFVWEPYCVQSFVLSLLFLRFKMACLMFENSFKKAESKFHLRISTCSKVYSVLTGSESIGFSLWFGGWVFFGVFCFGFFCWVFFAFTLDPENLTVKWYAT